MSFPVIVGWENAAHSSSAVAFATIVARPLDATVVLACVYPRPHAPGPAGDVHERDQLNAAQARLDEAAPLLATAGQTERRAIAAQSVAHGLHDLAETERARLLVVGSSHHGPVGRVLARTTATRLLHGAPCPIAVVPRDYHTPPSLQTVAVAVDSRDQTQQALRTARALALGAGAALRLIAVAEPPGILGVDAVSGFTYDNIMQETRAELRGVLDHALAELPTKLAATSELHDGQPAKTLAEHTRDADLLVVGSRGYGPLGQVLAGSVAAHLARIAPCPLLIVPRGAHSLENEAAQP